MKPGRQWVSLTLVLVMILVSVCFSSAAAEDPELKFELDKTSYEFTLYEGGTNNHLIFCNISNYDSLQAAWGGEPEWQITDVNGGESSIMWSNAQAYGKSLWLAPLEQPAAAGDYSSILSCTWNGRTASVTVTVHVIKAPNGPMTGSTGLESEYTIALGETLPLQLSVIPQGWTLPGNPFFIEHWITIPVVTEENMPQHSYERDGAPFYEITYGSNPGEMTLKGLVPGIYTTRFYVQCANYSYPLSTRINVKNADGSLPELPVAYTKGIYCTSNWPPVAVTGETLIPEFQILFAAEPFQEMNWTIEHNGQTFTPLTWSGILQEAGDYTLHLHLTDALGTQCDYSAVCTVGSASPLKAESFDVVQVFENGPNDHDLFMRLNYSGGCRIPDIHYKYFAKDDTGHWYMTWEFDGGIIDPWFWIGEDGDHYFKAEITDGVSSLSISSEVIRLGSGAAHYDCLFLPDDTTVVEESAFEDDARLHNASAGPALKRIEARGFANCTYLSRIYLPSTMEYIGEDAFLGASELIIVSETEDSIPGRYAREHGIKFETGTGLY